MDRRWQLACLLFIAAAFVVPAQAQQPGAPASAAPAAAAKPKPKPAPKPAPAKPAAAAERHEAPAVHEAGGQPKLLG